MDDSDNDYANIADEDMISSSSSVESENTPNKKTRYSFKKHEVEALLNAYKNHIAEFRSRSLTSDQIWKKIANELSAQNYSLTAYQLRNKFDKLKSVYIRIRNGADPKKYHFDYLSEFEEFFGKIEQTKNSPKIMSTSKEKSKAWSPFETQQLIIHFQQFYSKNLEKSQNNVWETISESMRIENTNVTPTECKNRWQNLLDFHDEIIENNLEKTKLFLRIENAIKISERNNCKIERDAAVKNIVKDFQKNIQKTKQEIEETLLNPNNFEDDMDNYEEEKVQYPDWTQNCKIESLIEENEMPINMNSSLKLENNEIFESEYVETGNRSDGEISGFQREILKYLREKEIARQKRHQENLKVKLERNRLIEKLINKHKLLE